MILQIEAGISTPGFYLPGRLLSRKVSCCLL